MICFVLAFPPVALCAMLVRDNELKTRFQLSVMGLSSIGALHPDSRAAHDLFNPYT
jgi:hypothetical protein